MNKFLLMCVYVICFTSCSVGKDQKIENAIEKIERKKFEANGEKIESLTIDSLKYEPASMQNFYSDHSDAQVNVLENYSERLQTITDSTNLSMQQAMQAKAQRQLEIFKQLQELSLTADTVKNLYAVEYSLNAKTDKNSYQTKVQKYVHQDNLTEVLLDPKYVSEDF